MNERSEDVHLAITGDGIDNRLSSKVDYHRTSADDDCVRASTIYGLGRNLADHSLEINAPANSLFTLTTVR